MRDSQYLFSLLFNHIYIYVHSFLFLSMHAFNRQGKLIVAVFAQLFLTMKKRSTLLFLVNDSLFFSSDKKKKQIATAYVNTFITYSNNLLSLLRQHFESTQWMTHTHNFSFFTKNGKEDSYSSTMHPSVYIYMYVCVSR